MCRIRDLFYQYHPIVRRSVAVSLRCFRCTGFLLGIGLSCSSCIWFKTVPVSGNPYGKSSEWFQKGFQVKDSMYHSHGVIQQKWTFSNFNGHSSSFFFFLKLGVTEFAAKSFAPVFRLLVQRWSKQKSHWSGFGWPANSKELQGCSPFVACGTWVTKTCTDIFASFFTWMIVSFCGGKQDQIMLQKSFFGLVFEKSLGKS